MFTVHKSAMLFSVTAETATRIYLKIGCSYVLNYHVGDEKNQRTSLNRTTLAKPALNMENEMLSDTAKSLLVKEIHCNAKFPRYVRLFGPRKLHSAYTDTFTQLNPLAGPSRIA